MTHKTPLRDRTFGFEMSGTEHQLIFEKENMGYVRFQNRRRGIFHLDPSPFIETPYNEIYALKNNCPMPPSDKLIEVTVGETEVFNTGKVVGSNSFSADEVYNLKIQNAHSTLIKYVTDWNIVDPNKIISCKQLSREDFLEFMSQPLVGIESQIESLEYCMALYTVSSPQITELEKGGINTTVLGDKYRWAAFKRITSIIPREFQRTSSRNFYKSLKSDERPNPVASHEINLAYSNITNIPIHIPLPFDVEIRSPKSYIENLNYLLPMARAYMIDSLLFQPDIPETLEKKLKETVYSVLNDIKSTGVIPYNQDIGSLVPKLTTSFARLNFNPNATATDIKSGIDLWADMLYQAKRNIATPLDVEKLYKLSPDARKLYAEMVEMRDSGVPLIVNNVKKSTIVFEWKFDDALSELRRAGLVYLPRSNEIRILDLM